MLKSVKELSNPIYYNYEALCALFYQFSTRCSTTFYAPLLRRYLVVVAVLLLYKILPLINDQPFITYVRHKLELASKSKRWKVTNERGSTEASARGHGIERT